MAASLQQRKQDELVMVQTALEKGNNSSSPVKKFIL
jgi:hypothetical protein